MTVGDLVKVARGRKQRAAIGRVKRIGSRVSVKFAGDPKVRKYSKASVTRFVWRPEVIA